MNRNEYRRALIMLRSLKSGVSGYVRLERRTLMGTLQFTINGVSDADDLYVVLLYRNGGGYSGIRLSKFSAPRYGQTGLVWKFDPRNIENRTLEQYDLAAVIEIRNGICELLLCGNLNGSVDADWMQVRDAACRLFSPVRISGAPISPIDERKPADPMQNDQIQPLPEYSKEIPAFPGEEGAGSETSSSTGITREAPNAETEQETLDSCSCSPDDPDELDTPTQEAAGSETPSAASSFCAEYSQTSVPIESDDFDLPAQEEAFSLPARVSEDETGNRSVDAPEPDELDIPATDEQSVEITAGEQLSLSDPNAAWPASVEPLRALFFSSAAVVPFEMEEYVFIRAPLHSEGTAASCFVGIHCEAGQPDRVCYAIPASYTPEPPAGLEGYVWRGDRIHGCWVICEEVTD